MTGGEATPERGSEAEGSICINSLRVVGRHGLLPEEQSRAQPFEVDVLIGTDLERAARSDDLADTIDYGEVVAAVVEIVGGRHFDLLEALAGAIADDVLARPGVRSVTVEVRKLRPPVAADLASAGVRLRRAAP